MAASERSRRLPAFAEALIKAVLIAIVLAGSLLSLDVLSTLGLSVFPQQTLGALLGGTLVVTFLKVPARVSQRHEAVPWYDVVLAVLAGAVGVYVVLWYPRIAYQVPFPTTDKVLLGAITILLVLEACRRFYGLTLPFVCLGFVFYAASADLFPEVVRARSIPWSRLTTELFLGPDGVLGLAFSVVATVVLVFVLFGQLLFVMGGGQVFADIATAAMGRFRGGPAKAAVIGSALFGSISGSAVANVVITGSVTIPMMKRMGYRPEVAGAVEAAASTGGLVTPPVMSVVAFLMAEYLEIPYARVVLAACLPAVLYFGAILVQVDLEAGRAGIRGLSRAELPRLAGVLRKGWPFLLPAPVLVFLLVGRSWEPARAGIVSVAVLIVAGAWLVRDKPPSFWLEAFERIGMSIVELLVIGAAVGLIVGSASFTGLGFTLSLPLLELGRSSLLFFLVVTALISIVLGMGLPGIAIYFMQVALVVPALVEMGVPPIAAHFFIYYFGVFSFITPPVAIAAIAAATIAGAGAMRTAWEAMKLGLVAFIVPFAFVLSPSLLGEGEWWRMAVDFATALAGMFALSAALRGFVTGPLSGRARWALGVAALSLFIPLGSVSHARVLNASGLLVAATVVWLDLRRRDR
ncbi:MAG TPA: TRAP transporter fused permease subunit [Vicinamibacteria bacterium]|nr:TRAP transporter fused permease subunit [Vicinamibacteria bacterium]